MKTFPKPLSQMEEKECLERCKGGDQSARNMLIEHNMRLVAHVVKKISVPGLRNRGSSVGGNHRTDKSSQYI